MQFGQARAAWGTRCPQKGQMRVASSDWGASCSVGWSPWLAACCVQLI
jgi:hypothetical protein